MRAASCVTGAVLAAVLAARAREVVRQSDARIKAQVEEALEADETLSGDRIFVRSVKDGVVRLGGKATAPRDDLRAMGDAARVPGVRRIVSEIVSPELPADEETSPERAPSRPPGHGSFGWEESRATVPEPSHAI